MLSFSSMSQNKTILGLPASVGEADELCQGTNVQLDVPKEVIDQMGPKSLSKSWIIYFWHAYVSSLFLRSLLILAHVFVKAKYVNWELYSISGKVSILTVLKFKEQGSLEIKIQITLSVCVHLLPIDYPSGLSWSWDAEMLSVENWAINTSCLIGTFWRNDFTGNQQGY